MVSLEGYNLEKVVEVENRRTLASAGITYSLKIKSIGNKGKEKVVKTTSGRL